MRIPLARILFTGSIAVLAPSFTRAAEPSAVKAAEVARIGGTIDRMKADLAYLTSDELAGRCCGSAEIEKAAAHVAAEFKKAGLTPAGKDGTWFQPFQFNYGAGKLGTPITLSFKVGDDETKPKYASEYGPLGLSPTGKVDGGLVFVGYGMTLDEPKYDDYAGVDVKGKIAVLFRRAPKWDAKDNPFQKGNNASAASLIAKADLAAKKGAIGVIFVNDKTLGKEKDELVEYKRDLFGTTAKVPVMMIKRDVFAKLLEAQGKKLGELEEAIEKDEKPQSFVMDKVKADLEVTIKRPVIEAKNVVGTLPGSGPLADEVVVIGAHYDHVGLNEHNNSAAGATAKGKIHHGADDNGSGTTGLMELARRFGAMKNRQGRRLVFVAFTGEELGLFGSKEYANNPAFPNEKTAFMLNMDMIGRSKQLDDNGTMKDRLVIYGHGTGEGLEKLVDTANAKFDFKLFKVPGGTGPSDHDSFYKKNIPVLFFFTGTHPDYHKPTDTADKINYEAMAKVVDMVELFTSHFATTLDKPKYLTVKGGWEDPTDDKPRRTRGGMPKLGITPGNYGEEDKGVLVDETAEGKAAEKAGIKAGDLIIEIAGKEVKNMDAYMAVMGAQKAGKEIDITVLRKKEKVKLKITPE
ncbi:hypothetical protein BH11PLA2_BH11PLA2_34030 [soil metagenome]